MKIATSFFNKWTNSLSEEQKSFLANPDLLHAARSSSVEITTEATVSSAETLESEATAEVLNEIKTTPTTTDTSEATINNEANYSSVETLESEAANEAINEMKKSEQGIEEESTSESEEKVENTPTPSHATNDDAPLEETATTNEVENTPETADQVEITTDAAIPTPVADSTEATLLGTCTGTDCF